MDAHPLIPVSIALGGILIGAIASLFPLFMLTWVKWKTEFGQRHEIASEACGVGRRVRHAYLPAAAGGK